MSNFNDIDELRTNIINLIVNADGCNNDNLSDLELVLTPASDYFGNDYFSKRIKSLIAIMTTDRNNNGSFDMEDIKMLGQNISAVSALVFSFLLTLNGIPDMQFKYKSDITEKIIFKIFAYIFLIIIPNETGMRLTNDDKIAVVDITLVIYNTVKSSELAANAADNIAKWLRANGLCSCIVGSLPAQERKELVIKNKLAKYRVLLQSHVDNDRRYKMLKYANVQTI